MALRQCEKCSEMVDSAKAFCPGCGQPLVEEQTRTHSSNFDSMDLTAQIGQTMYNQMLSDMGLNISKAPDPTENRVEVVEPIGPEIKPPVTAPVAEIKPSGNKKWIIAGIVALLILFLAVIVIAAAIFIYWFKFR